MIYLLSCTSPASDLWSFPNHRQLESAFCTVVWAIFTYVVYNLIFYFRNLCSLKKATGFLQYQVDLSVAVTCLDSKMKYQQVCVCLRAGSIQKPFIIQFLIEMSITTSPFVPVIIFLHMYVSVK